MRRRSGHTQTEFVQDVGQQHGLEQGIEGSKAKHTTIKAALRGHLKAGAKTRIQTGVRATKNHQSRIDGQAHGQV